MIGNRSTPPAGVGNILRHLASFEHLSDGSELAERRLKENPKEGKDDGKDEGGGNGKGEDAAKKVGEHKRKVEELIGKGKIRPPATTQIQQAVAQLAQAAQQEG